MPDRERGTPTCIHHLVFCMFTYLAQGGHVASFRGSNSRNLETPCRRGNIRFSGHGGASCLRRVDGIPRLFQHPISPVTFTAPLPLPTPVAADKATSQFTTITGESVSFCPLLLPHSGAPASPRRRRRVFGVPLGDIVHGSPLSILFHSSRFHARE